MQYFSKPVLPESDTIFHLKLLKSSTASSFWKAIKQSMNLLFISSWMPVAKIVSLIAPNRMDHESKRKKSLQGEKF